MEAETPRQISRAWQTPSRIKIIAKDCENNLSHKLLAEGDLTSVGEPKSHGAQYQYPPYFRENISATAQPHVVTNRHNASEL
jgi:hypothetical protein